MTWFPKNQGNKDYANLKWTRKYKWLTQLWSHQTYLPHFCLFNQILTRNVLFQYQFGVIRSSCWNGTHFTSYCLFLVASFYIRLHINLSARENLNEDNLRRTFNVLHIANVIKNRKLCNSCRKICQLEKLKRMICHIFIKIAQKIYHWAY